MSTILITILCTFLFLIAIANVILLWNTYKVLAQAMMLYNQLVNEVFPSISQTMGDAAEVIEAKRRKLGLAVGEEE